MAIVGVEALTLFIKKAVPQTVIKAKRNLSEVKGQLISKWFMMSSISSKKRTKIVRFHPKNDFRSFF